MKKVDIIPHNVITGSALPHVSLDQLPAEGDPVEINGELYFVCEQNLKENSDSREIGVIPLVVRNPAAVPDIKKYIDCLSIAHRKVRFENDKGCCDLEESEEMIIS